MDPCKTYRHPTVRHHPADKSPVKMLPAKWESDPTKDIQELFSQLDSKFFQDKMKKNGVVLEWTEKASSTAGYCYQLNDDVQKTKRCYIVLNKPLLRLRSRNDLVETLLHEMIHALLYTAGINENHGPNFRRIMKNINKVAGTNITVYHEFHDEVRHGKDLAKVGKSKNEMHKPDKDVGFVKSPNVCVPPLQPRRYETQKYVGIAKAPNVPPLQPRRNEMHKPDKHVGIVKAPNVCVPPLQPSRIPDKHKSRLRRVPSRSQDDLLSEILSFYKGAVPDRHIKLIGYDDSEPDFDSSDSDFDFTDSDSDFEYDQREAMKKKADEVKAARDQLLRRRALFYMKEDLKPWMNSTIFGRH